MFVVARATVLVVWLPLLAVLGQDPAPRALAAPADPIPVLLDRYCLRCHGGGTEIEGDLDLVRRPFAGDPAELASIARELRERIASREMPPADEPRPTDSERERLVAWAESLRRDAAAKVAIDPGRVTMRRLSRFEYGRVVADLFGIDGDPAAAFPADDLGYGFDNIGDALSFSLLHLETHADAAERIAAIVFPEPRDTPPIVRFPADALTGGRETRTGPDGSRAFLSRDRKQLVANVREPGRYRIHVRAFAQHVGDAPAELLVDVDRKPVTTLPIRATREGPEVVQVEVPLAAGRRAIGLDFGNDHYDPSATDPRRRDRNLYVLDVALEGPLDAPQPPAAARWLHERIGRQRDPAARARPVLRELTARAWRRPASEAEIDTLAALVARTAKAESSLHAGLRVALQATLLSPHFLYRVEPQRAAAGDNATTEALSDHALAARLSFFLWSSVPDETLRKAASARQLTRPTPNGDAGDPLLAQARRMLADPRADALATNFAAQWLELRGLAEVAPDPKRFPFDDRLRRDLRTETELFVRAVLREERPLRDLLDADHTFVNARLAAHYGIDGVVGDEFRRVALPKGRRGGLLSHGSILTVTSQPTRTSPVKRGKWILENLLDQPPPPPPPGADSFPDEASVADARSLREQMARHRADPTCASCHVRMDALGLALEHYDAVGRFRDSENGAPIDASGTLPDGRTIAGADDLRRVLAADPAFVRAVTKKLFLYAVGRGVTPADEVALDRVVDALPATPTFTDLVLGIVSTDAFRRRAAAR